MKVNSTEFQKILIVHTAFVGDVILMTPLIRAVKKIFPTSQVDALVIPETAELLGNNPQLRSIQIFDKRKYKFKSFLTTTFKLRKEKYDAAFLPHSSFTTIALVALSGIKERIGFDRNISRYLLTQRVPFRNGVHRIEKNLELMKPFSDLALDLQTELFPDSGVRLRAEQLLGDLDNGKKLVAIAPGSVWNTKRWPEEYYGELLKRLTKNGYGIVLVGSATEKPLCERIRPQGNSVNLAGETDLLESAAVLEKCKLLICNDSGAMHIANAVKTDVVAFFGPTVKSIGYFPYRDSDTVLELNLDCRPCSSHGGNRCPLGHHNCMRNMSVDAAYEVITRKLTE